MTHRQTAAAILNPRPGDRFTEMCSFWLYVLAIDGDSITSIEASAPCTLPRDGKIKTMSKREFAKRLAYRGGGGYWVRLVDRGNDVAGWLTARRNLKNG